MELSIRDLSVNLSGQSILKSVNLTVEDGSLISLLGPSGCGKSTLLKTIAGVIAPSAGSVLLNGACVDGLLPHRRGTVIVFQDLRLFPHMTAAENIGFPLKMMGISRKERLIVVKELLESVQLAGFERRKVGEMSGGQLQRVALARALAAKPNVLLLDEPFSDLDESLRQDMRKLVLELQKIYGLTTILVTHDKQEALRMSSKVAFMTNGEILQYDMPENIYQAPANREVAEFFCNGSFLDGAVENGVFSCDLFSCHTGHADGHYTAFIRPSAVRLAESMEFCERNATINSNMTILKGCFRVMEVNYCGEDYEVVLSKPGTEMKLCTFISKLHQKKIGKEAEVALILDQIIFLKS